MSEVKLAVFSPYDERLVDEVSVSDEVAAIQALALADSTFQTRAQWLPVYERKAILERFYDLFSAAKDKLVDIAIAEGGKPRWDSEIEAERALQGVKIAIDEMSHLTGQEIPMRQTPGSLQRIAMTYREPVGVVLAISAFNHPLNMIIHQVIPAIAVGAPVVVKPASSTPLSCFNIVNLLYEAGLPKAWCQALVCSNEVAENMVRSKHISYFNFIGSAPVGWHLRSLLPPGAECALEHGGAAPVIVEADADLDLAVSLLVKGGFYHAGQVCVSVQRVFANYKISKSLAKQIAKQAQALIVGDPSLHDTDVGPLIAKKEVNRIHQWVQEAVAGGAKLMCGGHKVSSTSYAPTVLLDPPADSKVACEEVFGPVICVFSYKDRAQAIAQANSTGYCFQAAVFTKDIDTALECVQKLDATAVMVNESTTFRVDWMPFGGRKKSGLSIGGIPSTMRHLTFEKMMLLRSGAL
jgi:acyl-CoA reductase-like NAD-dependent aldehyde dehydrogenase